MAKRSSQRIDTTEAVDSVQESEIESAPVEEVPAKVEAIGRGPIAMYQADVLTFSLSVPDPATHESMLIATDIYGNNVVLALVSIPPTATETDINKTGISVIRGTLERILRSVRV